MDESCAIILWIAYRFGLAFQREADVVGAIDGFFATQTDVENVKVLHSGSGEEHTPAYLMELTLNIINH